jgi:hypothetical protein
MKCPVCTDVSLAMTERQGVEIDYCPACRGVWLDRGELDKIIQRSGAESAAGQPPVDPGRPRRDHDHRYDDHGYHGKRKKSFLEDLFD